MQAAISISARVVESWLYPACLPLQFLRWSLSCANHKIVRYQSRRNECASSLSTPVAIGMHVGEYGHT